jgi:hypothetical protein
MKAVNHPLKGSRKFLSRLAMTLALASLAFTAFMGFAHTSMGRPLLSLPLTRPMMRWLGMRAGASCPMGYDHLETAADRQQRRALALAKRSGKPMARARNALDFAIGQTTRSEAQAWVSNHGGSCKPQRSSYLAECSGPFFKSDSSTLWLEFDANDRLVSARGIEKYKSPEAALTLFNQVRRQMKRQTGAVVTETGTAKIAILKKGLLQQVAVFSDFKNYSAHARLTNMGDSFAVTHDFLGF